MFSRPARPLRYVAASARQPQARNRSATGLSARTAAAPSAAQPPLWNSRIVPRAGPAEGVSSSAYSRPTVITRSPLGDRWWLPQPARAVTGSAAQTAQRHDRVITREDIAPTRLRGDRIVRRVFAVQVGRILPPCPCPITRPAASSPS